MESDPLKILLLEVVLSAARSIDASMLPLLVAVTKTDPAATSIVASPMGSVESESMKAEALLLTKLLERIIPKAPPVAPVKALASEASSVERSAIKLAELLAKIVSIPAATTVVFSM